MEAVEVVWALIWTAAKNDQIIINELPQFARALGYILISILLPTRASL